MSRLGMSTLWPRWRASPWLSGQSVDSFPRTSAHLRPGSTSSNPARSAHFPGELQASGNASGGQRLRLQLLEFLLVDGAAVQQTLRRRDLVCRAAALTGYRLDVLVRGRLGTPSCGHMALGHAPAASNQVDQCRKEGEDDQENDPKGLPPTAQFPVSEQITDDLEQHHQVHHEEKGPNEEPEEVPETIHCANLPLESKRGWGASAATHFRASAVLHLGVQRFSSEAGRCPQSDAIDHPWRVIRPHAG